MKMELAEAYMAAKEGTGSIADVRRELAEYERQYPGAAEDLPAIEALVTGGHTKLNEFLSESGASTPDVGIAALPKWVGKGLPVAHYEQKENYYCGPATGKMILKFLKAGKSKYDGTKQNQANLANANHMRTDINGATRWHLGLMRIGLNRWRQGKNTGHYTDKAKPTPKQFKHALGNDIDNNMPFAAGTVEWANGHHYNNHPKNREIGHWIAVTGYANSGGTTMFKDPATSVWPAAAASFTHATNSFVNRYLQTNGITW